LSSRLKDVSEVKSNAGDEIGRSLYDVVNSKRVYQRDQVLVMIKDERYVEYRVGSILNDQDIERGRVHCVLQRRDVVVGSS
jgi:hypothetical protein